MPVFFHVVVEGLRSLYTMFIDVRELWFAINRFLPMGEIAELLFADWSLRRNGVNNCGEKEPLMSKDKVYRIRPSTRCQ